MKALVMVVAFAVARPSVICQMYDTYAIQLTQPWPCEIVPSVEWRESYISMCRGMEALRSFDDAVKWADSLIVEISTSKPTI